MSIGRTPCFDDYVDDCVIVFKSVKQLFMAGLLGARSNNIDFLYDALRQRLRLFFVSFDFYPGFHKCYATGFTVLS